MSIQYTIHCTELGVQWIESRSESKVRRISDQNQYCTSTDTAPVGRARSARRQRETSGLMVQEAPCEGIGFRQAMATETMRSSVTSAWR